MKSLSEILHRATGLLTAAVLATSALPSGMSVAAASRASVHDPSIVKLTDGSYYIIGSHLGAARSNDLFNWTSAANSNLGSTKTTFFRNIYTDLAVPEKWSNTTDDYNLAGNLWAPDIIYNPVMGKYCMYLSVNGQVWNSSIVLCTADSIDGPYTFQGTIVYSGFTNNAVNNVNDTDVPKVLGKNPDISRYLSGTGWNASYGTNAIDPAVFYDESGNLWMVYGSWFGGIYMLELDELTGLRDYNTKYETKANVSDAYMGIRVAGGDFSSGEGPYIEYMTDPATGKGYYYLFVSYGYFGSNGGYNMRIFRSENPSGPYIDQNGNSAIFTRGVGDKNTNGMIGERLMSNYQWECNERPYKAQGHNSALMDDDGKLYVVYHTKFDDAYGFHEVRVHQMFLNEDGWLTAAPYEYTGEVLSETGHTVEAVTGTYSFLFHDPQQKFVNEKSADIAKPQNITLTADGKVSGAVTGTWGMENGTPYMHLNYNGITYKGVFLVQSDESAAPTQRMTFTATGNNTCIWGSKQSVYNAAQDIVDLTNFNSKLSYQTNKTSFSSGGKTIGDTTLLSDVSYFIKNRHSGKVLDLSDGETQTGTNIQQWTKTGGSQQEWRICDLGNGWCKIVSMADETMALTVAEISDADGCNVILSAYSGTENQQWQLKQDGAYYGIVSRCSNGKSGLDVYDFSTENGGNINQWEYWGGDCQQWSIAPVYPAVNEANYILRNVNSGLYLGANATNIEQTAAPYMWTIRQQENGHFSLISEAQTAITIENASAEDGSNAVLSAYVGNAGQSFSLVPTKDGSYAFLSDCSDVQAALDVYEISIQAGANICQWNYWGGAGQRWILIPVTQNAMIFGDVNADGQCTIADAVMLQKWLLGTGDINDWQAGDMNGDGKLDARDLTLLKRTLR